MEETTDRGGCPAERQRKERQRKQQEEGYMKGERGERRG